MSAIVDQQWSLSMDIALNNVVLAIMLITINSAFFVQRITKFVIISLRVTFKF